MLTAKETAIEEFLGRKMFGPGSLLQLQPAGRDWEVWILPVSSHPWKDRTYDPINTGIVLTDDQMAAIEARASELEAKWAAEAEEKARLEAANNKLHQDMMGKSWVLKFEEEGLQFDATITIDGLGWNDGQGCYGTFPMDAQTEDEAMASINQAAQAEILCATFCE